MFVATFVLVAALVAPPLRCVVYVDPVDFERRLLLRACEERGIECVQCWSPPYAARLLATGVTSTVVEEAAGSAVEGTALDAELVAAPAEA